MVAMGLRTAKRLAASMASQQHPQQLQMKATLLCTFSPNWTRLCSTGLVQQIHAFLHVNLARDAVLDERLGSAAEGHADIHGGIAGFAQVLHLVTAVAGAHAHVLGSLDDFAGSFVVHHRERVVGGKGLFVDKRAAKLGFSACEEVLRTKSSSTFRYW